MRKSWFWIVAGWFAVAVPFRAHDVITTNLTFSRDVSRIFASRCLSCHGSGSNLPLATYQQARPWAVAIKEQVLSRAMPPWGAVKGFGDLFPDNSLSQEEIMIIAAWVVGGAPEGDPATLPKMDKRVQSSAKTPSLTDALTVNTEAKLPRVIQAAGIKLLEEGKVHSAKIKAKLPDGEILPLLWLHQFDGASRRTFAFRSPLELPAGTVIESSSPLRFALEEQTRPPR